MTKGFKGFIKSVAIAVALMTAIVIFMASIGAKRLEARYETYCEAYAANGRVELADNPVNQENYHYMCN